jgi:ssDNA-binding Zn-finger/Zn-ribbon topoisomerase 1
MPSSKPVLGVNDLQSQFPEIAKEWHPLRNGDLKPTEVRRGSGKKVWWQCSKYPDHEWEASITSRTLGGRCPNCHVKIWTPKITNGINDLQSQNPELTKEWHPIRNGDLKPTEVTRSSSKKVWWQCNKYPDHEWEASINSRSSGSVGCPICSGAKVLEGSNDLKSTDPELAKEWHPLKNGDLKPTGVTRGSSKKVWWQCSKYPDHEWEALIFSRSDGTSCPICAEHGFNPDKDSWFYLMQRPGEQQLGITNVLSDRMRTHERNGWVLLEHAGPASGQKVLDTEKAFKRWLKKEIGLMEGTTENWSTTSMEVQSLAELKAKSGIEIDLF